MTDVNLTNWREHAACRSRELDARFFDESNPEAVAAVKRLCKTCPSAKPCLIYALQLGMDADGIYGGMTPTERQALRSYRSRQKRQAAMAAAVGTGS